MRMTRTFVSDLADGDTVEEVFLLADKQLRANRNADMYLLATLRDKTGVISGLMWNVPKSGFSISLPVIWCRSRAKSSSIRVPCR